MLNQVVIVGRLVKKENDKMEIAVPRSFKNEKGEYKTDTIKFSLGTIPVGANTTDLCQLGDLIGIKGIIQTGNEVIAEKFVFLSKGKDNAKNS